MTKFYIFDSILSPVTKWFRFLDEYAENSYVVEKVRMVVQSYYYALLFLLIVDLGNFSYYIGRESSFFPRWPLVWLLGLDFNQIFYIVLIGMLTGAFIGAIFWWNRAARIITFLTIWQFHAYLSSFGQPNHQWYPWLYVAFLFMFLPNSWKKNTALTIDNSKKYLYILFAAQAFLLLTYSMSGAGKVYSTFLQWRGGMTHLMQPDAFPTWVAYWLDRFGQESPIGFFVIENKYLFWPFFVGNIYIQFFAFLAAFRPALHRFWAFSLVAFHIGTLLTMNIYFNQPALLLLVLLAGSPFVKSDTTMREILYEFPLIKSIRMLYLKIKNRSGNIINA